MHYFSGKGCSEFLEIMHYCIGILTRHGRKFDSQELRNYFESKSWYVEKYDGSVFDTNYSDQLLSNIEKKNAEFLKDAENRAQNGGYQLDQ